MDGPQYFAGAADFAEKRTTVGPSSNLILLPIADAARSWLHSSDGTGAQGWIAYHVTQHTRTQPILQSANQHVNISK